MSDDAGCLGPASADADEKHKEHLELAAVIKGVHAKLRQTYRETGDFSTTWDAHCQDQEVLSTYASAMHHLAVDHWTARPETRIHWCRDTCHEYFLQGGLEKALSKDQRTKSHEAHRVSESSQSDDVEHELCCKTQCDDQTIRFGFGGADASSLIPIHNHRQRYTSEVLVLPSSPPMRYPDCPSGYGVVEGSVAALTLNNPRVHAPTHAALHDRSSSAVLPPRAERSCRLTPESEPHAFWPRKDGQQDPLDKCQDFMTRMDLECPNCQPDEDGDIRDFTSSETDAISAKYGQVAHNRITLPFQGRIRLLDVGSCFNPFLEFQEFIAIGIDISPAVEFVIHLEMSPNFTETPKCFDVDVITNGDTLALTLFQSVFHCDLLHLDVSEPLQVARDTMDTILTTLQGPSITKLPGDSFHVVVFSLLLEYFPCAYQRWLCCQKAQALLVLNGLLIIITPDSGHQNRNAAQMKSWKRALESMGFKRWRYTKQEHLHCMAYRKVRAQSEETLLTGDAISPDMLYIPQDFNGSTLPQDGDSATGGLFSGMTRTDEEVEFIRTSFSELPDMVID